MRSTPRSTPNTRAPERAFVVQLLDDPAETGPGDALSGGQALHGRVEHVQSGRHARFDSLLQLSQFMRDMAREQSS